MSDNTINYASYLKLGTGYTGHVSGLLDCVHQLSDKPEEHLFITVHHGFEIWFKQILFDLGRVKTHLDAAKANRGDMRKVSRELGQIPLLLRRSRDLFRNLLENFNIIETMGQLAFIDFRAFLTGGSGFQSHQFRIIENSFGLKEENRKNVNDSACRMNAAEHGAGSSCQDNGQREMDYKKSFTGEQSRQLEEALNNTIFDKIQDMLENIVDDYGQDRFVREFQSAAEEKNNGEEDPKFNIIFDEACYKTEHIEQAKLARVSFLSYKAFLGALIVHQFQLEPQYQIPYQIITLIVDFDEVIMSWRARHVNMVHRMIGVKVGTGGTSGYEYLYSTLCDRYKVFLDLFVMSTYILPSEYFHTQT